jgi:hypothetical protein
VRELAVVVGIASIVVCSAPTASFRPRPNGPSRRRIERLFLMLSGHVENDAGAGEEATLGRGAATYGMWRTEIPTPLSLPA